MENKLIEFLKSIYVKSLELEQKYPDETSKPSFIGYDGYLSEYINTLIQIIQNDDTYIISSDILMPAIIEEFHSEYMDDSFESYDKLCSFFGVKHYPTSNAGQLLNTITEKLPKEFGQEMEKLYFDDSHLIGLHGTALSPNQIQKEIFENGLLCNYENNLVSTVNVKGENLPFDRFLRYIYKPNANECAIIVCIPNEELQNPMWRQKENSFYLNPKYLYGYYLSHRQAQVNNMVEIIHNPKYLDITNDDKYTLEDDNLSKKCVY